MIALLFTSILLASGITADECSSMETDNSADSCYLGYVGTPVYEVCVLRSQPPGCAGEHFDRIKDAILPLQA